MNSYTEIQKLVAKSSKEHDASEGESVLVAGRWMRDLNTFVEAMVKADIQAILLAQVERILAEHPAFPEYAVSPRNVKEIVAHGGDRSFIGYIQKAVVLFLVSRRTRPLQNSAKIVNGGDVLKTLSDCVNSRI